MKIEEKWYSSRMANRFGIAAIIVSLGFSGGYCTREFTSRIPPNYQLELEKSRKAKLEESDLNGNGIPEKFYVIDNRLALIEIDGKPISEYYKK